MVSQRKESRKARDGAAGPAGPAAQENISQRTEPTRATNKQQVRHRASVACASCRDRRIRCVVPQGESNCVQCKKTGTECIIKNDDERRRPISKAYMSSLSDRIAMLEGLLLEKGVEPPPAAHPPKTRQEGQPKAPREVPSPLESGNEGYQMPEGRQIDSAHDGGMVTAGRITQPLPKEHSPLRVLDSGQKDAVRRLLSTKGNLSFDQLSGRLRFFGPTANSHVHAEPSEKLDSREPPEQVRRAERIIRSLTAATHDYLMSNFWTHYNSALQIVDQGAFEADRESQSPKFYSSFLHICVLAMAFRFADADRDDMKGVSLGYRESTLHREAKYMLDVELERPGGIPSVQALLILGDLECGVGRDNTGWMYAGMANRLAFDIGLHLGCRSTDMGEHEFAIRHMVMRACVIYDKYWALFLGRPTSIKNQDVGLDLLSRRFSELTSLMGGTGDANKKDLAAEIYDQLFELMEMAGRIVESRDDGGQARARSKYCGDGEKGAPDFTESERNAYLDAIKLDRQLQNWYRRLPEHLQWKPSNIKSAPISYFLLHQQYHVSLILLHRPWAKYGAVTGDDTSTGPQPSPGSASGTQDVLSGHPFYLTNDSPSMCDTPGTVAESRTSLSRNICTQQAIKVARVFWQHRQRFDGTKIFVTGIQHAGTAAVALIAALACGRTDSDRRTYLGYLEILSGAVSDMSHTYQPAASMDALLRTVLVQVRADVKDVSDIHQPLVTLARGDRRSSRGTGRRASTDTIHSILPARREAEGGSSQSYKRRRPSTASRRGSLEYSCPQPSFSLPQAHSMPPEDFVLVAPQSTTSWPLGDMGADGTMQLASIDYDGCDFEGLGAHNSGSSSHSPCSAAWGKSRDDGGNGANPANPAMPRGFLCDEANEESVEDDGDDMMQTHPINSARTGDMDWIIGKGGLEALSPVSLNGLVHSTLSDKERHEPAGFHRNTELDFFSF